MIRRWGVVVVAVGVLVVGAPVVAQDGEESAPAASTVRIQARLLESAKVEFGLQFDGERVWLPRARLFPYPTAVVGRWLFSSPYTLSDATVVRIQARRLESGKVEFGLQFDGERVWLPRARLFPYPTAVVGRWLFSSPYSVADGAQPEPDPPGGCALGTECAPPAPDSADYAFAGWLFGITEEHPDFEFYCVGGRWSDGSCGLGLWTPWTVEALDLSPGTTILWSDTGYEGTLYNTHLLFTVLEHMGRLPLTESLRRETIHGVWLRVDKYTRGGYVRCDVHGYWLRPGEEGGWHWLPVAEIETRPCD